MAGVFPLSFEVSSWLRVARIGLLPTALSNFMLGYWLARGSVSIDDLRLGFGLLVAALVYAAGMAMNDFADAARDQQLYPKRPIPSGALDRRAVGLAILLALGVSATISSGCLGPVPTVCFSGIVIFAAVYNFVAKEQLIFGPLTMGGVRLFLVLFGAATAGAFSADSAWAASIVGSYVTMLTYYSLEEERARPQILRLRSRLVVLVPVISLGILGFSRGWQFSALSGFILIATSLALAAAHLWRNPSRKLASKTTYRFLLNLFALDTALLLFYDLLLGALFASILGILAWTRPFRLLKAK